MTDQKIPTKKSPFTAALDVASSRMLSALSGYHIWKWMSLAVNINSPGGEEVVERNLAVFNRYSLIFQQIRIRTYKSFVADLAIFFDKVGYEEAFSVKKLLELSKDKLSDTDVLEIETQVEQIKREHGAKISFLLELRNADVAHQEMDSKARHLLYQNIEDLFGIVQKILNLISNKYDRSVSWWNHVEKEINHQMKWVVDNLERGEMLRLEEVKKKFADTVSQNHTRSSES